MLRIHFHLVLRVKVGPPIIIWAPLWHMRSTFDRGVAHQAPGGSKGG